MLTGPMWRRPPAIGIRHTSTTTFVSSAASLRPSISLAVSLRHTSRRPVNRWTPPPRRAGEGGGVLWALRNTSVPDWLPFFFPLMTFLKTRQENRLVERTTGGIIFAFSDGVGSTASTYDEPTVLWRMRRGKNLRAHAVIGLHGCAAWVMWFLNDRAMDVRDFDDCESALQWSNRLRDQNWTIGWRLVPENDQSTPP